MERSGIAVRCCALLAIILLAAAVFEFAAAFDTTPNPEKQQSFAPYIAHGCKWGRGASGDVGSNAT